MLKKLFSLQKLLDALFDEGWCHFGLPEEAGNSVMLAGESL